MHRWDCGIPCRAIGSEILPEVLGREAKWHDDRRFSGERRKKSDNESVDVVEWHDEHGAVRSGEVVGLDFVCHCLAKGLVGEWDLEMLVWSNSKR